MSKKIPGQPETRISTGVSTPACKITLGIDTACLRQVELVNDWWPEVVINKKLKTILKIVEDKKGDDVRVLDVSRLTWITNYFVILSGQSVIQTKTIAETLLEKLHEKPLSANGLGAGKWILLDYQDVMVHIFLPETRDFYRLEKLWGDAQELPHHL